LCKILIDASTQQILGAHILGPQAATLIEMLVLAMEFGIHADDLARRPYWIHPALTEVDRECAARRPTRQGLSEVAPLASRSDQAGTHGFRASRAV
jgi:pyridine nucleotide-disulfide oxidoreductase